MRDNFNRPPLDELGELGSVGYFGGCPQCTLADPWLNVGRSHWGVCHKHKVKWFIGENILSSWRDETEEQWRRNERLLMGYKEVEPLLSSSWNERGGEA